MSRGDGRIFRRGRVWWIGYYHHGAEVRESAKTTDPAVAQRKLRARLRTVGTPGFIGPREERVRFEDLAALYLGDYTQKRQRTLPDAERLVRQLRTFFGRDRALEITPERIQAYIAARRGDHNKQGAPIAPATINRELSALRRMFRLAVQHRQLVSRPHVPMLPEDNVREGFVDPATFATIERGLRARDADAADVARFLFLTAWRLREATGLTWREVDEAAGTIRLPSRRSKTKRGRVLALTGDLLDLIRHRAALRRLDCAHVFHRGGRPVRCFRVSWRQACAAAGVPGLLLHDLRRSAVRNMVRAGVPLNVAMRISGHQTDSIFRRYDIVDEHDLADALTLTQDYVRRQATAPPKVTPLVTTGSGRRE